MPQVILVTKRNRKIGEMEKLKVHREALLHRGFSILIFNLKNEILLQKRAKNKYHSGGLWTNACCSHPRSNETYTQAVHKRLKQEMGFDCPLTKQFCFIYKCDFKNGLTEHEYLCVYFGRYDGSIKINPAEASTYKWISLKDLKKDIKMSPGKYTYWFKLIVEKI